MLKVPKEQEKKAASSESPATPKRSARKAKPQTTLLQQSYFPLLVCTTLTSALFAYLYITSSPVPTDSLESLRSAITGEQAVDESVSPAAAEPAWLPTGSALPSTSTKRTTAGSLANPTAELVDPNAPTVAREDFFENTNQLVQYVMVADLGNGKLQEISAELPAKYQSRMLRIAPEHRKHAEYIFARLKQLQKDMGALERESESLLRQWNQLLVQSSPYEVLRPDSPTLHKITDGKLPDTRLATPSNSAPLDLPKPVKRPTQVEANPAPTVRPATPVKRPRQAAPTSQPAANEVIVTF
ncbi:hypothetical protein [Sulfuriroseicoccus oceanibius]|uniref:Uncharacterized protein n=1 Tax=Sulfuriroseicoccus oceanibius TaxID=2707525 RepID=A0A6B3L134_9BACT|nr:hypothetical protein [Sulfuriroseicoccus oceanibius]QQL43703.1 hypothetical protein G3M56_007260 [Sulfuriroseicoccus oceanibius]